MPGTKGHIPECVGGNFGHARTIEEALHNLQQVESLVDFISNAIEERISLENSRLQKLNSKVEFFKRQIDVVASNPQRATTVYSAAHFPRSEHDVLYDYSTALFPYQPSESTKKDFYIPKPEKEFKNGLKLNDASEIFVHLYESAKKDVAGKKPHYGLGSLPSNISSISSTLLFNTQNVLLSFCFILACILELIFPFCSRIHIFNTRTRTISKESRGVLRNRKRLPMNSKLLLRQLSTEICL